MLVPNQRTFDRRCLRPWSFAAASATLTGIALISTYGGSAAEPQNAKVNTGVAVDAYVPATEDRGTETTAASVATGSGKREQLRFAGRSFEEWRDQLLNDLDAETCVKAMPAIVAFGRRGYAEEAVVALAQTLHDDRDYVVHNAAGSLAQIGAPAVPTLIEGLSDRRPAVRMKSARALGNFGSDARAATVSLLKLLSDQNKNTRSEAITALVAVAGNDDTLRPAFEKIADSNDSNDRWALLSGLQNSPPHGGLLLEVLVRFADDGNAHVRAQVGPLLAHGGPPEKQVIDSLKELAGDSDPQVWASAIQALVNEDANTATTALVLADLLLSPEGVARVRQQGAVANAIDVLASARDQVATTVPALTAVVDLKGVFVPDEVLRAIQGLGRLGPLAKPALPALKRWANGEQRIENADNELLRKQALRALLKIRGPEHEP